MRGHALARLAPPVVPTPSVLLIIVHHVQEASSLTRPRVALGLALRVARGGAGLGAGTLLLFEFALFRCSALAQLINRLIMLLNARNEGTVD